MELYLLSLNSSLEFTEKLQRVKDECSVDFDGSKLHKYISILVGNIIYPVVFVIIILVL
jgi:hypothetical protein